MEAGLKAIIIAAGRGSRLRELTTNSPKCLLEIGGKTIIQNAIDHLRSLGVNNISVVKGYLKDKICFPGLNYYINENYQNNNILESLFYAERELSGDVIILYSDIIFKKEVVEKLIESKHEISIVTDVKWATTYIGRRDHPIEEAEKVIFNERFHVQHIGKILPNNKEKPQGEFIGMMKLSGAGPETLKRFYHSRKEQYKTGPFQRANSFQVAYLTDIIQEMVDHSVVVNCVPIENEWREIDTIEDFTKARTFFNNAKD
jgi:L-glutamine-phosphate cytidylyltransferase